MSQNKYYFFIIDECDDDDLVDLRQAPCLIQNCIWCIAFHEALLVPMRREMLAVGDHWKPKFKTAATGHQCAGVGVCVCRVCQRDRSIVRAECATASSHCQQIAVCIFVSLYGNFERYKYIFGCPMPINNGAGEPKWIAFHRSLWHRWKWRIFRCEKRIHPPTCASKNNSGVGCQYWESNKYHDFHNWIMCQ